jgi:hypothetical protein
VGETRVEKVAEWISEAMQGVREERGQMGQTYTIYIVVCTSFPFSVD